ncbi:hypothetical protein [Bradyrhizobium sp.]|uniref:hypothetical protein n=1 Tax=Bradyrhizobium sp. TaxID=376 RepID=UPI001D2F06C4|nr:hypothetical protein [Bradyrhizobium sp.]MBI5320487.1 hypothetical protein [Bradyrhizobium sp.]
MNSISRAAIAIGTFLCAACATEAAFAQFRAQYGVDVLASCTEPAIKDIPLHMEGTGVLKTDRSAEVTVDGSLGWSTYGTKLGQTSKAPGGSAALRVTGRSSLRAIRDYPNHQMIIDMHVSGKECAITVRNVLKPGRRDYIFVSGGGSATCEKPRIVSSACQAF